MTCRVVKFINGRPYLYEQTSYRVGNKVHTKTKYLGSAAGFLKQAEATAKPVTDDIRKQIRALNQQVKFEQQQENITESTRDQLRVIAQQNPNPKFAKKADPAQETPTKTPTSPSAASMLSVSACMK